MAQFENYSSKCELFENNPCDEFSSGHGIEADEEKRYEPAIELVNASSLS